MQAQDTWKNFESTGSVQEYLRYKHQQITEQPECTTESNHADCNIGTGSARSKNG